MIMCAECYGDGVAETIDGWARPCEACYGRGEIPDAYDRFIEAIIKPWRGFRPDWKGLAVFTVIYALFALIVELVG